MNTKQKSSITLISKNRRAWHDYEIIDVWEAGLQLQGLEVKALRDYKVSIAEAWVRITKNTAHLVAANITAKQPDWIDYKPDRDRKLLLHKRELKKLQQATQKGLTVIPLRIYFNQRGLAKLEIATAKGRKKYDKRRAIQERDQRRYGF